MSMLSRDRVESVLNRIRPMLQADGGDIELVDVQGNIARVRLTGMCSGCPSAHMTLYMGVEMALRDEISEFEELQIV
jgi:Fe-S cluster biogenesis protein NfuA